MAPGLTKDIKLLYPNWKREQAENLFSVGSTPIESTNMIIKEKHNQFHVQVNLVKGNTHYTCWVPAEGIEVGKVIELEETRLDSKGISQKYFDGGWVVVSCGGKLPSSYVLERGQDYKRTRKASDI